MHAIGREEALPDAGSNRAWQDRPNHSKRAGPTHGSWFGTFPPLTTPHMLREEFELYGGRFRWFEGDAFSGPDGPHLPLLRMRQPLPPESVIWFSREGEDKPRRGKCEAGFVYRFEGVAEFLLPSDGSYVKAFLNPQAAPGAVAFVLSRGVIPRVLHLRGITCLHASAVAVGGRIVAFCGPSGSGKSTLAAAMAMRGYSLVTDDVLPLRASDDGDAILAGPGLPEVRLHPSTAAQLGIANRAVAPGPGQTKAVWRPETTVATALRLSAIYLLELDLKSNSERDASVLPATPQSALLSLLSNSFWLHAGETAALAADLTRFAQVVRSVPIARLSFCLTETGVDLVERLIFQVSSGR
jgi:hypothetical protein